MRESYYSVSKYIKGGYDIVFVARNTINGAGKDDVQRTMYGALKGSGLLNK